ncbi:hypothetical protein FW774_01945 (plasmid) [Pedobacter sp. BS3]|uniref:hypothetical protein n=1 Tax=Pedobacter sp. BS3 TaxID=2567937 RepID=UPI0011EC9C6F|nr:hypothetical protein [Pedobacter sp. BS3]TZF85857.1 hypothetical protein FW774_01945 [Pedobacter sp. BS3]
MATLTVQIADKDKDLLLQILKRFNAKVLGNDTPDINAELAEALKEVKLIRQGKRKGLTLKDMK